MNPAGNVKHRAAVEKTADLVDELRTEISDQLRILVKLAVKLEDLAGTHQSVGLGFMTEQTKELANKQAKADRAAARNLHPARAHVGLKFMNSAAVLGSGQVEAPVTINAVSVAAEIRYTLLHHLRRLSRPAFLRVLEEEQANAEDHGICVWPRNPVAAIALDVDAGVSVLADRLEQLLVGYRNRTNLQALNRELEHLETRARNVIDGPQKTNHPDPCPWCGRMSLAVHHRAPGRSEMFISCDGTHRCVCDDEWCDCHRDPTKNRHEWVNSGRAKNTVYGRSPYALTNLVAQRKETVRMETLALDALIKIRAMHQPFWIDADGDSHPYYVLVSGDELEQLAPDHACIDVGFHTCDVVTDDPAGSMHSVPGCVECQATTEDGPVGNHVWPCATYRATQLDNPTAPTSKE